MVYKRCPKCKSAEIKCTGGATTGNPAHSFYECLDCHAKFDYKQAEQAGWDFEIIKNKKNESRNILLPKLSGKKTV